MLTACPVARKAKSAALCEAFMRGAPERAEGRVFYGVDASNMAEWAAALQAHEPWYYIDNAYFDPARGTHFRAARRALQHSGVGASDGSRWRALGIPIASWRADGAHVVLVEQSPSFLGFAGLPDDWGARIAADLARLTGRRTLRRPWHADKPMQARTLVRLLRGAHCVVTWTSAAAITAILAGIPAVCLGACAAAPMAGARIEDAAAPPTPDGREAWAGVLADNQWTLDEMRAGVAWEAVGGG